MDISDIVQKIAAEKIYYVIAWVAEGLGLEGETISFGNSFHRDGGWAAEHYPQHYPGVVLTAEQVAAVRAAGKGGYVNSRTLDEFGQWTAPKNGDEA
ncbi:MAG TPA: hypothetical protein VI791_03915 [Patescibacteria group bacterium]|nr:hypothetical protein [Patescibacteria group bacterium]